MPQAAGCPLDAADNRKFYIIDQGEFRKVDAAVVVATEGAGVELELGIVAWMGRVMEGSEQALVVWPGI